ncbi:MAG: EFR1 family ferrodoxin [Lachnospiraceae bacterium]|nr:EFR1 family ferrodoxin [Lachnospiraceae bacterium]
MVLYYTGTGNSEYVANKIGEQIGDNIINLFDRIRKHDYSEIKSDRPFIIVYPTYAWQMPRILRDYILKTKFTGNKNVYFVTTCGAGMGNMSKYVLELCKQKSFTYMGCAEVVMPENYIAMFHAPKKKEAVKIIKNADLVIKNTVDVIRHNGTIPEKKVGIFARISSGMVNAVFYPAFVSAKKFYATDACIGCGKCVKVCPLNNIKLKDGKPVWGDQCTHCMACICKCPEEAIEYGNKSKGKPRYQCPL